MISLYGTSLLASVEKLSVFPGAVLLLDHVTPPSVLPWISTSPPALNVRLASSESFHAARGAAAPRPRTSPPASAARTLRRRREGGGARCGGERGGGGPPRQCREYFAAAARRVGISFALPVGLGFCFQCRAWPVNAQGGGGGWGLGSPRGGLPGRGGFWGGGGGFGHGFLMVGYACAGGFLWGSCVRASRAAQAMEPAFMPVTLVRS